MRSFRVPPFTNCVWEDEGGVRGVVLTSVSGWS